MSQASLYPEPSLLVEGVLERLGLGELVLEHPDALVSLVEGMRGGPQPGPENAPPQPVLFATGSARRGVVCVDDAQVGEAPAVITEVEGSAYISGRSSFVLDERDPLGTGFLLR